MRRSRHVTRHTREPRRKKSYHRSWICDDCRRHAYRRQWRSYHNPSCVRFHTFCEDIRRKRPHHTYHSKLWRGVPKGSCEICRARQERHRLRMAIESNESFETGRNVRERKAFRSDNAEARPWKVLPKDSCEVYRARHKRHQQTKIVVAQSNEKSAGDQIEPQTNDGHRSDNEIVRTKNPSQLDISSN